MLLLFTFDHKFFSTHRPWGRTWWDILMGAQLQGMHTDAFGNFILLSWPKLSQFRREDKLLIELKKSSVWLSSDSVSPGACWPLIMHVVCSYTHSSTFINLPLERALALGLHAFALLQHGKEKNVEKAKKNKQKKRPLHVPRSSLLARHDNTASPSFVSLGHVRQRHLFYFHQRKRSPPYPKTCLFMEMVEGWRRKHSWGNAVEKVLARSDLLFAGGGVQPEAGVFFLQAWAKYAVDVWRTLIYGWNARPSFLITWARGVSFLKDSQRSWSLGSSKG